MANPNPVLNLKGRQKGSKNRTPERVVAQILKSLDFVGGTKYLAQMAVEQPVAYLSLIGKVIPRQSNITGSIQVDQRVVVTDAKEWLQQQITALHSIVGQKVLEHQEVSNIIDVIPSDVIPMDNAAEALQSDAIYNGDADQPQSAQNAALIADK